MRALLTRSRMSRACRECGRSYCPECKHECVMTHHAISPFSLLRVRTRERVRRSSSSARTRTPAVPRRRATSRHIIQSHRAAPVSIRRASNRGTMPFLRSCQVRGPLPAGPFLALLRNKSLGTAWHRVSPCVAFSVRARYMVRTDNSYMREHARAWICYWCVRYRAPQAFDAARG